MLGSDERCGSGAGGGLRSPSLSQFLRGRPRPRGGSHVVHAAQHAAISGLRQIGIRRQRG